MHAFANKHVLNLKKTEKRINESGRETGTDNRRLDCKANVLEHDNNSYQYFFFFLQRVVWPACKGGRATI